MKLADDLRRRLDLLIAMVVVGLAILALTIVAYWIGILVG